MSHFMPHREEDVRRFVTRRFAGRTDKGSQPYIGHLFRVAEKSGERIVGLLHDAVEDLGIGEKDLIELGCTPCEINDVMALTRHKGEDYDAYLDRLIAYAQSIRRRGVLAVKKADLEDNMSVHRLPPLLTEQDFRRLQKYRAAYGRITDAMALIPGKTKDFPVRTANGGKPEMGYAPYRLFIDDDRFPETPDWFVARNSYQAIRALEDYGMPVEIAFDHDLGGQDTAMTFLKRLCTKLEDGKVAFPSGFRYSVHSMNPIGAKNIRAFMENLLSHFPPCVEER